MAERLSRACTELGIDPVDVLDHHLIRNQGRGRELVERVRRELEREMVDHDPDREPYFWEL